MYIFNLEPVLNQRKSVEEKLQKELAVLRKMLADENEKLALYKEKEGEVLKELQQERKECAAIFNILLHTRFLERLSSDIEKQKESILDLEEGFDEKREELVEAMKKRKVMEKLKEKKFNLYQKEVIKKEQAFMNEVALNIFNRKT